MTYDEALRLGLRKCLICDKWNVSVVCEDYDPDFGASYVIEEGDGGIMGVEHDEVICKDCVTAGGPEVEAFIVEVAEERARRDQEFKQKVALLQAKVIVDNLEPDFVEGCRGCQDHNGPRHKASIRCQSGRRNHCSCDTCF